MGLLRNLIIREYGIQTAVRINPETDVVNTSPVRVLSNNPNRLSWVIVNLSGSDIWLGFDREVSSTKGLFLASGGSAIATDWRDDFELVGYEVWAIASADNSPIYVLEVVATKEIL